MFLSDKAFYSLRVGFDNRGCSVPMFTFGLMHWYLGQLLTDRAKEGQVDLGKHLQQAVVEDRQVENAHGYLQEIQPNHTR